MKFNWNAAVAVVQVMENDSSIPNIKGDGYEVTRTDSGYHIDLDRGEFEAEPAPVETPAETPVETPVETPAEIPTETPAETPSETPIETPSETPAAAGETAPGAEETAQPTGTVTTPESTTPEGDAGPVATS